MLLVVGGIKGGSGKTTIATNLAVMRLKQGKKTLLIDADEQRSASDWAEQREAYYSQFQISWTQNLTTVALFGKSLYAQLQKMMNDYDDIIIDTGGRDTTSQRSALTIADKFLIPFKPKSFDVWTVGAVKNLINEIQAVNQKLQPYFVINQADSRGTDNSDAVEVISEIKELNVINTFIGQRKAFSNAAAEGLSVIELEKKDAKACEEIEKLHSFIYV